jgi:hypothetical protein
MPIVIGDRERMYRTGHELRARGLWVAPVEKMSRSLLEGESLPSYMVTVRP